MASTGSRTLKLSILADVANLSKGLNQGSNEVQSFGSKVGEFGKKAALAFAAAGIAAAAFAVKFAKDAIVAGEAASTANARIEQINESMGLFGNSIAVVSERLIEYAEKTARLTGIDTNSIKATQAKLLTFKELALSADKVGGAFDRATDAAIDLGAAGFGSAETNAVALGKALNDPIKGIAALNKQGITFTEVEKERIKTLVESNKITKAQDMILKAIETQVGGTAEATANATDRMKVGFQQVTERVGIALLPVLEKVTSFLLDNLFPAFEKYILPIVQKVTAALTGGDGSLSTSLSDIVRNIKGFVLPIFNGIVSAFGDIFDAIKRNSGSFKAFADLITTYVAPVISTVLGGALTVAGKIASAVIDIIGRVVGGIATLINGAISGVNMLIKAYNAIPFLPNVSTLPTTKFNVPSVPSAKMPDIGTSSAQIAVPNVTVASVPKIAASNSTSGTSGGVAAAAKSAGTALTGMNYVSRSDSAVTVDERQKAQDARLNLAKSAPAINLTVNQGIVGDPEGAARAVIEVLNDSYYRGTSGADALVFG